MRFEELVVLDTMAASKNVNELRNSNDEFCAFFGECLGRWLHLDFGDISPVDIKRNIRARKLGKGQIFASYPFPIGASRTKVADKLLVVLDYERSVTAFIFPSDY